MPSSATQQTKLITFSQSDSAYSQCLYAALRDLGVDVVIGPWSGQWLLNAIAPGDVIHLHWPSFFYYDTKSRWNTYTRVMRFVVVIELAKRRGARVVWTAHNLYPHDGGKQDWVHRLMRHYVTRTSERILAHGKTAARIVAEEFGVPEEKIAVIPHGHWIGHHAHTLTKSAARQALGIAPDKYVVTFVGTCKPYKNLDLLIETFAQLGPNCELIIAGSFQSLAYERHVAALIKQRIPDRTHLRAGFVADEDVQKYMLAGDVLVLPYTEILTSGSAMLGLSFGVPVIAPNAGGLRDVVNRDSGELYDPTNPSALLQTLQAVRAHQYSPDAIIAHAKSFDWADSAKVLIEILRRA